MFKPHIIASKCVESKVFLKCHQDRKTIKVCRSLTVMGMVDAFEMGLRYNSVCLFQGYISIGTDLVVSFKNITLICNKLSLSHWVSLHWYCSQPTFFLPPLKKEETSLSFKSVVALILRKLIPQTVEFKPASGQIKKKAKYLNTLVDIAYWLWPENLEVAQTYSES